MLCLLLGLLAVAMAKWNGTVLLYPSKGWVPKVDASYNADTGVVHTLSVSEGLILHRRFVGGKWSDMTTLYASHKLNDYLDILEAQYKDAAGKIVQHIVMIYDASRSGQETMTCNDKEDIGCHEVYIVESDDDGATWTAPVSVPRADMHDRVHRMKANLAYDRTTKTVFLAYSVGDVKTGKVVIRMVSKVLPVVKFSNEVELKFPGMEQASHPKMGVTNTGIAGKGILHMLYLKELGNGQGYIVYSNSENLGVTWSEPVIFDKTIGAHVLTLHSLNKARAGDIFISYTSNNWTTINYAYSRNGGKTWTPPKVVREGFKLLPYVRACGENRVEGYMLTIYTPYTQFYEIHYFNMTNGKRTQYTVPFRERKQLENVPLCDCYSKTGRDLHFYVGGPSLNDSLYDQWDQ